MSRWRRSTWEETAWGLQDPTLASVQVGDSTRQALSGLYLPVAFHQVPAGGNNQSEALDLQTNAYSFDTSHNGKFVHLNKCIKLQLLCVRVCVCVIQPKIIKYYMVLIH